MTEKVRIRQTRRDDVDRQLPRELQRQARRPEAEGNGAMQSAAGYVKVEKDQGAAQPVGASEPRGANEPDAFVELPDTGPPRPSWQDPELVDPLLVVGDARERELAEQLFRARRRVFQNLDLADSCTKAADAKAPLAAARRLVRSVINCASNLSAYQSAGIQELVKLVVRGPTIGLRAKTLNQLNPTKGSPEAYLVERLADIERAFETSATVFWHRALSIKNPVEWDDSRTNPIGRAPSPPKSAIDEDQGKRNNALFANSDYYIAHKRRFNARHEKELLEDRREAARWSSRSDEALAVVPVVAGAVTTLQRRRRQVMIIEERKAAPDELEVGDANPRHSPSRRHAH